MILSVMDTTKGTGKRSAHCNQIGILEYPLITKLLDGKKRSEWLDLKRAPQPKHIKAFPKLPDGAAVKLGIRLVLNEGKT